MKHRLTFKTGKAYRNKATSQVYVCKMGDHPWDRTKRLCYINSRGTEIGIHISQMNRKNF